MAVSKSTTLSIVCFAAAGALLCALYHTTAIYSYGLAVRDIQYGWPFRYGFDQHDVTGEFLWNLASFDVFAFLADIIIGVAAGAFLGWIAGTMRLRWGRESDAA